MEWNGIKKNRKEKNRIEYIVLNCFVVVCNRADHLNFEGAGVGRFWKKNHSCSTLKQRKIFIR